MNRKSEQSGTMLLGPSLALATFLGGLAYGLSPRASATVDSNERALARSAVMVDYAPNPYPWVTGPADDVTGQTSAGDMATPPGFGSPSRDFTPGCPPDSDGRAAGPALGNLLLALNLTPGQARAAGAILDHDRAAMRALFDVNGVRPDSRPSPGQMLAIHFRIQRQQSDSHARIVKLLTPAQARQLSAKEMALCAGEAESFGMIPPPGVPT